MISAKRLKELKEGAEPKTEAEGVFQAIYEAAAVGATMKEFFERLEYPISEFNKDELRIFILGWSEGEEEYRNSIEDEDDFLYYKNDKKIIH